MVGAASQARDADSSRVPGLTSGLLVNVHRGATVTVHQFFCILHPTVEAGGDYWFSPRPSVCLSVHPLGIRDFSKLSFEIFS